MARRRGADNTAVETMADQAPGSELQFTARGEGPPILALHGFGATSYSWRHLERALGGRGKLFLFDLKGHGSSPAPPDDRYSVKDQADLILSFIRKGSLRHVNLIGHSFGAAVALLVAIELVAEGENRVASLILLDALMFPENFPLGVRAAAGVRRLGPPVARVFPAEFLVRVAIRFVCMHPENITDDAVRAYAINLQRPSHVHALIETAGHLDESSFR